MNPKVETEKEGKSIMTSVTRDLILFKAEFEQVS